MSIPLVIKWLTDNISPAIKTALAQNPQTLVTEADLAGLTIRETGGLIALYAPKQPDPNIVCSLLRGDFSKRPNDTEKIYHGFGLTQVDIDSFPDFVKSGDWKIPVKCYAKTLQILSAKQNYLTTRFPFLLSGSKTALKPYVIASYNCGEGNEAKVIDRNLDVDAYTASHNYSKDVAGFAQQYVDYISVNQTKT